MIKIGESSGHGSGSSRVYAIEARLVYPDNPPVEVDGFILDGVWRQIPIYKSSFGVPNNLFNAEARQHGYLEHDAAMALAYWFIASAKRTAVEVRLIQYKFDTSYTITKMAELKPVKTHYSMDIAVETKPDEVGASQKAPQEPPINQQPS